MRGYLVRVLAAVRRYCMPRENDIRTVTWESLRDAMTIDGSLRDIYVLHTGIDGWRRALDGLRRSDYGLAYFHGDQQVQLPLRTEDAFPCNGEADRLLVVRCGGILANCHFFTDEEIEFDVDPREVTGQRDVDDLIGFMRCLAVSTGRDAILCPESCPEIVLIRIGPN